MQRGFIFIKQFFALTIIFSLSSSIIFGQKKSGQTKPVAQKCSGAWTGSVKYTRTQTNTENKTEPRISGAMNGEDSTFREMKYEYKAKVLIAENAGSARAKAVIDSKMTSTETTSAKEKISCDRGKTWQTQTGNFKSETKLSGKSDTADANVRVGINNDGTYNVSVALPQIRGEKEGSYTASFGGQCKEKKGVNEKTPPAETSISGNSLISDGSHRFDGKNPNYISGSYTQKGIAGMEETISWKLRRCGCR